MPGSVLLTSTTNSFEAKVIAARLLAEGLHAELRGAVDGPYASLAGMAETSVWVPEDQLDDARLVMIATEVDNALGAERRGASPKATVWGRIVIALVVASLVLTYVWRVMALA